MKPIVTNIEDAERELERLMCSDSKTKFVDMCFFVAMLENSSILEQLIEKHKHGWNGSIGQAVRTLARMRMSSI